ncbi:hypothetical protein [Brachybacterium sp. NBEC-018]|nr:hypothetical protein [Brachybacterium sp. NBEC-018]
MSEKRPGPAAEDEEDLAFVNAVKEELGGKVVSFSPSGVEKV